MSQTSLALALSGITFLITVIWGTPFMRILHHYRLTTPAQHGSETPAAGPAATLGGVLFLLPVTLLVLLMNFAALIGFTGLGASIFLPLSSMLAFAALGAWVDWRGVRRPAASPRRLVLYLGIQLLLAAATAWGLHNLLEVPDLYLPFYRGEVELGLWYLPVAALVILGMVNAVQSTEGVDGLPGLLAATAFVVFGGIAVIQDQIFIARFCFTLVGALLGFLWFNIKPAALLMGRTGTYALGATLAVLALMTGYWPLLMFIALMPVLELSSFGLERAYALFNPGGQLLRATPLHAHLMANGWSATQIVQRFWLINLLFATIGITLTVI